MSSDAAVIGLGLVLVLLGMLIMLGGRRQP